MPKLIKRPNSAPLRANVLAVALAALLAPLPVAAQSGDAGSYLAARVAAAESDYRNAAAWYARALVADPANPALMEGAIIANIG
ncbi:MAG TPA: hypothetical protein VGA75_14420, partial [Paracoccaceae bacterium]